MPATGFIDRAKYEPAMRSFNARFNQVLAEPALSKEIATAIESSGSSETYNWLGAMPRVRQWIGDRAMSELLANAIEVPNVDWSAGVRIAANDIDDDRLGLLGARAASLAEAARSHHEELLMTTLIGGFASLAYDGQFFFDTDHLEGDSGTLSNKGTSALSSSEFDNAVALMGAIKDSSGRPLGFTPTHLIVGPKLRAVAKGIIEAEFLASGASNTNFKACQLVVSPWLSGTSDDYWFVLDCSREVRPLILQQRRPPTVTEQSQPGDEGMFNRREIRMGVDWRGNALLGLWQLAFGAQVA